MNARRKNAFFYRFIMSSLTKNNNSLLPSFALRSRRKWLNLEIDCDYEQEHECRSAIKRGIPVMRESPQGDRYWLSRGAGIFSESVPDRSAFSIALSRFQ